MTEVAGSRSSHSLHLDHVVARVDDLLAAVADYRRLGFEVFLGGEHADWGSCNAIVPLADGTYLELITFPGPPGDGSRPGRFRELELQGRSRIECRILSWAAADEGTVDLALLPADTAAEVGRLRRAGLDYDGPLAGMRVRPDGQQVRWEMAVPDGLDLPFLCGDVTPRRLRVPGGPAREHGNGACGIAEAIIAVTDAEASRQRYRLLLGADCERDPGAGNGEGVAAFQCGQTVIRLAGPSRRDSALARHLERRGPGPFRIGLRFRPGAARHFDVALLHGAVM